MAGFDRFNRRWAATGILAPPTDAQADTGFAFLGPNTPTVELFNSLFADLDDKDNWLFNNISRVLAENGVAASATDTGALLAAIRALIPDLGGLAATDQDLLARINALRALRDSDITTLGAFNVTVNDRIGVLQAKTGGRLVARTIYFSPGSFTHPFNGNAWSVVVSAVGAGGAGGRCPAAPSGQIAVSAGGASGSFSQAVYYNVPGRIGATAAVVVGAGGDPAATDPAGLNGGASSFAGLVSAAGGIGGQAAGPSGSFATGGARGGLTGSIYNEGNFGGTVILTQGSPGHSGFGFPPTSGVGGAGASGPWGGGGPEAGANQNGNNGGGPGAGGGGAVSVAGTGPFVGGRGAPGAVIVEEYSA